MPLEPTFMMFARWNLPPGMGEPAFGFILRLVREQGIPSLLTFNLWNEVSGGHCVEYEKALNIIEQHPFPEEWKLKLRHATPKTVGKCVEIGGQAFRRIQLTTQKRRWCPACLAEQAYHRVWWDVVHVRRCPYHGLELETRDVGGGPVSWTWTDFETSRNGYMLARYGTPPYSEETFARYMIGRMGFDTPIPHELFDRYDISTAIRFCEMYGRLLSNPFHKRVPDLRTDDIDIGFRASKSREVLTDNLRTWIRENARFKSTSRGQDDVFGWLRGYHFLLKNRDLEAVSRAICREASSLEYQGITRPTSASDFERKHTTIRRLAPELKMSERGVQRIADELGLIDRARLKSVLSEDSAVRIAEFARELLTASQTRKLLGISHRGLPQLVAAGHLKSFVGLAKGRRNGGSFDLRRINAILDKIQHIETGGNKDHAVSFWKYCKQTKVSMGQAAVGILDGRIKVLAKADPARGFSGLTVEGPYHIQRRRANAKPVERRRVKLPDYVNSNEAAAILSLSSMTVCALREAGHLGLPKKVAQEFLLPRQAVLEFATSHARISLFENVLRVHPTVLNDQMLNDGVVPVISGQRGRHRLESVYRRSDMLRVFGLETDTSMVTDSDFQRLWVKLQRGVEDMLLTMYFPPFLPRRGQRVWASSSCMSVLFEYDDTTRELCARIVPRKGQGTDYRLPLNITEDCLMQFLLDIKGTVAEAKARKSRYERIKRQSPT
ncbi:TniQ family protein [Pararhizobium antarcticum]|uniref:TniQ domain-containing protein n=1 Tax=Pararhizobium antarcticum TaxID=1798805 RepID=A0A657LWM4_9HYPH|nr:TniQ family protein [Pararhizobium antarcticum]OJG00184.1 hypothetical protein AX760_10660 [Pararhizobium antarcticum]OJG00814.1 hypothetical protein AX761_07765 [Rhizobium sp. 58]